MDEHLFYMLQMDVVHFAFFNTNVMVEKLSQLFWIEVCLSSYVVVDCWEWAGYEREAEPMRWARRTSARPPQRQTSHTA